ncbi:MAG TPA: transglycosylase SLT domain-containing protein, partial [Acidimicrobiia bacterium]|nr:transglycosylase SLT domain-containing protein [Acidimicrobiia bacterium]
QPLALAQSAEEAEDAAERARERSDVASGMVDEAVANREDIERQLAESIARLNELTAELSRVGANIDRVASQVGYADIELAGIQADIEDQAVDAYMTVVASPSVTVVNTDTVEEAMVASSVVEDVVADGRSTVNELFAKRRGLEDLKAAFLADQEEYQVLQEAVDAEVANYTSLYEQADATVAAAIRDADAADRAYRSSLSAVEAARAVEEERQRQDRRQEASGATTSTASPSPTTTQPSPATTDDGGGGGGGPWEHPPHVEQWRGLVSQFFPSSRVEEALVIIDCESNGNPNASNPYSGAGGLFQFLPSTWATTSPNAGYPGASVFDPEANIASAAWLANRYQELGYSYWHPWSCRRMLG